MDVPLPEGCGGGSVHALEAACRTRLGGLGVSAFCEFTCGDPVGPAAPQFRRGDADDNGSLQLTDGIFILNFLFLGGADPVCGDAADADNNGAIQLTDGIFILNFLFLGGDSPGCFEAADADDNGSIQMTDGIYILNFLFLGGAAMPAPHPDCGANGEDDEGPGCEMSSPACG